MAEAQAREQRRGRRWAMKALFMWDAQGGGDAEALVREAVRMELVPAEHGEDAEGAEGGSPAGRGGGRPDGLPSEVADGAAARFAASLVAGTVTNLAVIDALLESLAPAWGPGRMAAVDRALLRLGCYEIMYGETPEAVAVSEAVDLARAYSTSESPRFVNGILGAVAPRRPGGGPGRPPRARAGAAAPPAVRRRGGPV